ncbi:MAG: trypsin-like peptidase domain-containing protein [Chloroflexota bacterium]|nr:trypsin-like peptidase domain-containing protein [Chloroflexota bacterium]
MSLRQLALPTLLAGALALVITACGGDGATSDISAGEQSASLVGLTTTATLPAATAPVAIPDPTATATAVPTTPAVTLTPAATAMPDTAESALAGEDLRRAVTIPDLVDLARPSVVHIVTEVAATDEDERPMPGGGVGTGFIISADGYIVTNNHVVAGADRVVVTFPPPEAAAAEASDTEGPPRMSRRHLDHAVDAEIVGLDPQTDLAVIRIDAEGLTPLPLGSSADLRIGEVVVAIGHALDLPGGPTVTAGVVSSLGRVLTNIGPQRLTLSDLIQTDASINPGNSGGPLLNLYGEVVGVNSAGAGAAEGIGFAIAIDNAKLVIDALIEDGVVTRGFMGIRSATITPAIARQFGLPVNHGLYIQAITVGSGADQSDLEAGDIIVGINDESVADIGELGRILAKYGPGSTVTVWYLRTDAGDEAQRTEVTLGVRPDR